MKESPVSVKVQGFLLPEDPLKNAAKKMKKIKKGIDYMDSI